MSSEGEGGEVSSGLPRLPPGRHGLPRDFVTRNQRERIAAGIIATVAEHGYHEATITQIVDAAGVSRRTFYSYFETKEDCFSDTYELIVGHISEAMIAAANESGKQWPETVAPQLTVLLETFAANLDLVRFCFVASLSAGEGLAERFRRTMERLLNLLTAGKPPPPATREPSEAIEQGIVGGMAALIIRTVGEGKGESLPELTPSLVELVLVPYLGREDAARVASQSSQSLA